MTEILNDSNFDEFIKNNQNVMIDFSAEWCGPCKMLDPIIDELAEEYQGKNVEIRQVNVAESVELAKKFNIMSIPTILYFKDGKIKDTAVGLMPKDQLKERIDKLISS